MPINQLDAKAIFNLARKIEDKETRTEYLRQISRGDIALTNRVIALLHGFENQRGFLESPVMVVSAHSEFDSPSDPIGSRIGPYELLEKIGEGGMGMVYLAVQKDPVRRKVALKVIKPGMDSQQVLDRFQAERQALAMMNHPNIARVLDVGTTESGRPYFAMELVKGIPITELCDQQKLNARERLQLLVTVCHAVQYAHQKGIIHRDIKPSNVLVEMHDVTPVPKVIDFGVAKAIGQQLTDKSVHTGLTQMIGTPLYMSPEQAGQSSVDVDTRSDVFSLGVLLYEILTGHTPFESETLKTVGFDEMRRMIREVDPPRPSARVSTLNAQALSTISDARQVEPNKLCQQLRGELDWIVMKTLEKDRSRRYESASALAADIERFLCDDPVLACPPSIVYRFQKYTRRHRLAVGAALITTAALLSGIGLTMWQAMVARDAQRQTEEAKQQLAQRYRIAKESIDTYLLRITQDEQLDHPSFRPLRQRLLEAALPYYDQLHKLSPTDDLSQSARAEALNQLGRVQHELGLFSESRTAFEESAKLFDQLGSAIPSKTVYRQSLANVLVNLADHYRTRGDSSSTLAYEQHALELRKELYAKQPTDDLVQMELAQSYTNVGILIDRDKGRKLLEDAIQLWQGLSDRFPVELRYREYLSLGYHNLGHQVASTNVEDAKPFHQRAAELRAALAEEQPESKKAHIQWAQSEQVLADMYSQFQGNPDEVLTHRQKSEQILREFSRSHPQWPEVKAHWASSKETLARSLSEQGELQKANDTLQSAVTIWQRLVSEYPDVLEYNLGLSSAQQSQAVLMVARGESAESLPILAQARERLQETLDRVGPHAEGNLLMRNIYRTLAETRKSLGQDRDRSSEDEIPEPSIKVAGEAIPPSKFLTDLSYPSSHGLRGERQASSLSQPEDEEQTMKRQREKISRSSRDSAIRAKRSLIVESLEERALMAVDISISNGTMDEIGSASAFVAPGSGGLSNNWALTLGPDNNVYVVSRNNNEVMRYNGTTGQFLNVFVSPGSGGLSSPQGLAFGPDGNMYVASSATNQVLRYNGSTGAFLGVFISAGSGLNGPWGPTFGPDGNLYVSNNTDNSIVRYKGSLSANPGSPFPANGQTGAIFVTPRSGDLLQPQNSAFGPDGNLYVIGGQTIGVLRYSGLTGAFMGQFVSPPEGGLTEGRSLAFDQEGRLYVADFLCNVHRYDTNGNSIGDLLADAVSAKKLAKPLGMAFDAQGALLISVRDSNTILRYDTGVVVSLSSSSSTPVSVDYATADGSASASTKYYSQSGTVTFSPGQTSRRILLAAKDNLVAESSKDFSVKLSNATGGANIVSGTGTVTINDDDSTRQISIVDTSATEGDHAAHYRGAFVQGTPGIGIDNLTFGPDGKLYSVASSIGSNGGINRFDATTGLFIDRFVPNDRIHGGRTIAFQGGYIYVPSSFSDEVLRYNATTGVFVDAFVSARSGGVINPQYIAFGPDANSDGVPELYVASGGNNGIQYYDGATGSPLGTFIISGSGGLNSPNELQFDSSNTYLYVVNYASNQILKYDAHSGAFVGVAASTGLSSPRSMKFGSDGLMYVLSSGNSRIMRFNLNGTYKDDYVPVGSGGWVNNAWHMAFGPDGDLYVTTGSNVELTGPTQIMRFGTESEALLTITNTTPSTLPITVNYSTTNGSATAGSDFVASTGTVTFSPGVTTEMIRIPLLDDAITEPTETFNVILSNPVAATIARGQAIVSILDNDPFTKFYVVDDASADKTYEYQASGGAVENYGLNTGNTAPRGAASTAAGTTVWVVDANKKVYLYDTSGNIVGSWSAGGLQFNAQVEGIATDGKDVWLVDNQADRVYYYSGAASLTSGSPNATSSFSLNSGNKNAKDIVTDGNYLWVVNDSNNDKVFKYTVAGTYVGSWTISTSGAGSPTGITLDPANVSNIWIVDNGTDRVYQYNAAAGITSGSKSANSSFALAAGNTNPQGIADPTPPNSSRQLFSASMAPPVLSKAIDSAFTQLSDDLVRSRIDRPLTFDREVYRQNEAPFSTQRTLQPTAETTAEGASRGYNRGHTRGQYKSSS